MKCAKVCKQLDVACPNKECRMHIDFPEDNNCALIAIEKNGNMILEQVGKRLGVTAVRIKQIESEALKKIRNQPAALKILQ